jgi:hypothetical protein
MWLSAASLLGAGGAVADRGDLGFRARVLWHVLDGSQFHRLMQTGGLFEDAARVHAPAGLFGIVLAIALVIVGLDLLERGRKDRDAAATDPRRFLWIATVLILGATLALPGAVRAHHQLNAFPFTQIVVACAIEVVWRRGSARTETMRRVGAVATLLVLVAANVRVTASTVTEIEATGGRGRWTGTLAELAVRLEAEPGASAVSLDWGFHEPLLFMTDAVPLEEAIWAIPRALGSGRPWVHAGDASTRYLAHGPPYDLFGLGPLILSFARAQPRGTVEIEIHRDRAGNVAFHAIRFLRPHRLRYTGRFALD